MIPKGAQKEGTSATSPAKAKVKNGRLLVDTEAPTSSGLPVTLAYTVPWGEYVLLADNDASIAKSGSGTISGINFDVAASTGDVTLVLAKGTTPGSGMTIWRGTIPAGPGNLSYTFEDGIYITSGGFNVTWSATSGSPDVAYQVYGDHFGVTSAASRASP